MVCEGLDTLTSWENHLGILTRVNWLLVTVFGGCPILAVSQVADFPEETVLLHHSFYFALSLPFLLQKLIFLCHQNQKL